MGGVAAAPARPAASGPAGAAAVRRRALALGFDAVGIARADSVAEAGDRLRVFLGEGRHGTMTWMARRADQRADPRELWAVARSVVVVAANCPPESDPLADTNRPGRGAVATYARGRDYHDAMKRRLKRLGRWLAEEQGAAVKVFVDTAPVMEKPLAERAGLGWQGKHTNLVSRDFGSWLLLGEAFTDLDLTPDPPSGDACGSCRRCLDICPTDAFPTPYQLDARRCISYLTIEHKGHIPRPFRAAIGNRVFGCDDCLAVCPWNKYARKAATAALAPRPDLAAPALRELAALDDSSFRRWFAGSPIKRTGRDRFVRNVLIAVGNSGDPGLSDIPLALLGDASPLVRAMAVWALFRLDPEAFARERTRRRNGEAEADVRREWSPTSSPGDGCPLRPW